MALSDTIRCIRRDAGFGGRERTAHQVGVGVRTWARWESGEVIPSDDNLRLIDERLCDGKRYDELLNLATIERNARARAS